MHGGGAARKRGWNRVSVEVEMGGGGKGAGR